MKYAELEYKYKADAIGESQFLGFVATNFDILDMVVARGRDHFFGNGENDRFIRFRKGMGHNDSCEFTIKVKTQEGNSWSRAEVDIPLNKYKVDLDTIAEFTKHIGYDYQFSLDKLNYVIRTPGITFAYYVVNGNDRYLEIEAVKGSFTSEAEAFDILRRTEEKLGKLGISSRNRTKKSLYEMYNQPL